MDEYKKKAKDEYVFIADDVTLGPFCSAWVKDLAKERENKLEKITKKAEARLTD